MTLSESDVRPLHEAILCEYLHRLFEHNDYDSFLIKYLFKSYSLTNFLKLLIRFKLTFYVNSKLFDHNEDNIMFGFDYVSKWLTNNNNNIINPNMILMFLFYLVIDFDDKLSNHVLNRNLVIKNIGIILKFNVEKNEIINIQFHKKTIRKIDKMYGMNGKLYDIFIDICNNKDVLKTIKTVNTSVIISLINKNKYTSYLTNSKFIEDKMPYAYLSIDAHTIFFNYFNHEKFDDIETVILDFDLALCKIDVYSRKGHIVNDKLRISHNYETIPFLSDVKLVEENNKLMYEFETGQLKLLFNDNVLDCLDKINAKYIASFGNYDVIKFILDKNNFNVKGIYSSGSPLLKKHNLTIGDDKNNLIQTIINENSRVDFKNILFFNNNKNYSDSKIFGINSVRCLIPLTKDFLVDIGCVSKKN